jgi:NAD(P)-dependent dehydrogenase (short-subunit alcohol dehydrogenase family)/predicted MFS family arabinose efflux permease
MPNPAKTRRFLGIGLADGVRPSNLATHYYASLFGLSLLLFFGVIQPFVLTSVLNIPLDQQGGITGKLGVLNEITLLILTPLFGIVSDRIGRKPVFVFGFIAIGAAAILYTFLGSVAQLFAFRIAAAVGSAAISGMFATVIADYVMDRDRGKGTGLMGFFNGLGAMLAVLVLLGLPAFFSGKGIEFGYSVILTFYVVSAIAIVSSVVLMIGLRGGLVAAEAERKSFAALAKEGLVAAKHPAILLAYLAAFVSRGDLALVGSFLTLWLNKASLQSGLTEVDAARQVSLTIVIVQSVALLSAPVVGIMVDRLNAVKAVTIAAFIAAIGYGSLFFIQNPFGGTMKLALAVVGFGEIAGVITSQVLIAKYAKREIRGSVIGFFGFCGAVGIMTAFGVGGYVFDNWKESAPFLLFAIFGLGVAGLGLILKNKIKLENDMKTIVITGSTRGIGYGLANEFLKRGCKVVISGRTMDSVESAVKTLSAKHNADNIFGVPCEVSKYGDNQSLWDAASAHFGQIDVWINNAGISNAYVPFWEVSPETIAVVNDTNMLGAMNGSHVALKEMTAYGSGQLYNMYGFGSDGRKSDGLALYGATKAGLRYLTEALAKEAKDTGVVVASLSPGIVLTDMWDDLYEGMPERKEKSKKIVNILGDKVETVTPFLAEHVLANDKNGAKIAWLTGGKAMWRFATAVFSKRDLFN